ncbi:perlucin-like protein [Mya arenaria]|uniref:perlucin-like protein n=1 Tax=Mya arenaria TaxID=6604 RepID=UPI0022E34151|nr:perlucin-like protein [Mya arenaria]
MGVKGADCPDGFEVHQGACYFFSHGEETWTGAYDSCVILGGHLVEVNDVMEDTYLSGRTRTLGDYFWIGLEDKAVEGEWMWASSHSSLEPDAYTNWGSSEPDGRPDQNCVLYAPSRNYQWADAICTRTQKYICEKSADEPVVVG